MCQKWKKLWKKTNFEFAITLQNVHWPPCFISYSERAWVVDSISCIILVDRALWRHYIVIWSKKFEFLFFTLYWTMFFWLYLGCFYSIFSQISICCSWDCELNVRWHLLLIYLMRSWSNFWFAFMNPFRLQSCPKPNIRYFISIPLLPRRSSVIEILHFKFSTYRRGGSPNSSQWRIQI